MARIPDRPPAVTFSEIDQKSVKAWIDYRARWDGGAVILQAQVGYGLNGVTPASFTDLPTVALTSKLLNNLTPGEVYYFWSRVRNSVGWSPWSPRSQVTLLAGAWIKTSGGWVRAVPYVKVNGVWKLVKPYVRAYGVWKPTA